MRQFSLLVSVLLIAAGVTGQGRGLPGQRPGTERWLVTLWQRSFELGDLRAGARRAIAADLDAKARADQADVKAAVEALGGTVVEHFWIFNGCAVELPADRLEALRQHPRVRWLHPDRTLAPTGPIKTATNSQNHQADALQAQGIRGIGACCAVVDTGLDTNMAGIGRPHAAFYMDGDPNGTRSVGIGGSRILANTAISRFPADDLIGHGTEVAAVALGGQWVNDGLADHGHAPQAAIVGYGVAEDMQGNTTLQTLTRAWQAVAADAATYRISVANQSYAGAPDPLDPSQQAMDTVALVADVLVVVGAGNNGGSTAISPSAVNGLAVGATDPNTRTVAFFSSRGPLQGDAQRFYPDLVANGVDLIMPAIDAEAPGQFSKNSGTSYASPQVAGAATLYRSLRPQANHLEVKAALLASAEDVSQQNNLPPYNTRNAYGVGYLRDDSLMKIALGGLDTLTASTAVTTVASTVTIRMPVRSGKAYAVAIAWDRLDVTSTSWSDLDLDVRANGQLLASSQTPRNTYEKVVFQALSAGTVDLVVRGTVLERPTVNFALAAMESPLPFVPGTFTAYGQGCLGTGQTSNLAQSVPAGRLGSFGNSQQTTLLRAGYRTQHIYDARFLPSAPLSVIGFAFRHDDDYTSKSYGEAELEMDLGFTTVSPAAMGTVFAANATSPLTKVVARRKVALPLLTSKNNDPNAWLLQLPLDAPFAYAPGNHLLHDCVCWNAPPINTSFYPDGHFDPFLVPISHAYSTTPTAAQGLKIQGDGMFLGLLAPAGFAVPLLAGSGVPNIGDLWALDLSQARPGAAAVFGIGFSDTTVGSVPLPFDLAPLGAAACQVLASAELSVGLLTNAVGQASLPLTIADDISLIGMRLYHQAAIVDPTANALGIAVTHGVRVHIGGQP